MTGNGDGRPERGGVTVAAPAGPPPKKTISVAGAAFLGVGAMVGAGIFALLGQAGAIAGSAVWLSFAIAGLIALLLGYAVAKLGVRYPSSGGLITYLIEGLGRGHLTGVASWLFYFAGLIVTAMVAVAFGSYGAPLFFGDGVAGVWVNLFASAIVVAMVVINVVGASTVAKVQSVIVLILLAVFAVFIAVTLADADWGLLAPSTYPSLADIVASVALTFFAYIGFAVISFTAGDLRDPRRQLPRAMYLGVGLTTAIYVLISLGTFGALTSAEVERFGDTALAHAAEPALGQAGFTMMSIAALLATASSVNANLFAAGNITALLASERQFPPFFGGRALGGPRGLMISAAGVLVLANIFDLTAIAEIGSVVAMMIFLLLGLAALRLRGETNSSAAVVVAAMLMTTLVLLLFLGDTLENSPVTIVSAIVIALLAVILERLWTRVRDANG